MGRSIGRRNQHAVHGFCSSSLTPSASEVLMTLHSDAHLADGEELKLIGIYITCTIAWAV